jgi:hypothetical protein
VGVEVDMRVIVVGSVRGNEDDPAKADAIRAAANEVGKELAARGHVVLVGTDNADDVDPSVVAGALSANDKAHIEVHAPQGMLEPFKGNTSPNLRVVPHPFPDWDVTNMEVIREADGVIAIAGRAGVVLSGISGWMLGVSVIPVGFFGGGAMTLWQYASSRRQACYHGALRDAEIDQLAAPWGKTLSAATVVETFEKVVRAAKWARTSVRLLVVELLVLFLAMLAWVFFLTFPFLGSVWLFGGWNESRLSLPMLFLAVSAAGLLGAGMQTLRAIRRGDTVTSMVIILDTALGVAAGIVTAMLYLLAEIGVSGTVQPALPAQDFVRVALIVSMASLFASLYLDAALARFDKIKGSVFSGKYGKAEADE